MANFAKQTSSRIIKANNSQWPGTGTVTATLGSETFQVRIFANIQNWVAIDNGSALLGTAPSTAAAPAHC
jgi:hypothetical protein